MNELRQGYVTMADNRRVIAMKLVPDFNGDGSVSEWLDKLSAVCGLNRITDEEDGVYIMALRLTGRAYRLYQQMPEAAKRRKGEIERVLLAAYEVNSAVAYEQLMTTRLEEGDSVDDYLATLKKLASLIGDFGEKAILCAFMAGLPTHVRDVVRSGVNVNGMSLAETVERARAEVKDAGRSSKCVAMTTKGAERKQPWRRDVRPAGRDQAEGRPTSERPAGERRPIRCYLCDAPGHVKSWCPSVECFRCGRKGHMSPACPGNETRD